MFNIEQVREATTFEDMRAEIARLRREDIIVRQVMDIADYRGMSSEDRYTALAYYALQANARAQKLLMEYVVMAPTPAELQGDKIRPVR